MAALTRRAAQEGARTATKPNIAGMVGHDFFKPYAVTFDFENMQIFLQQKL